MWLLVFDDTNSVNYGLFKTKNDAQQKVISLSKKSSDETYYYLYQIKVGELIDFNYPVSCN